VRGDSEGGLCAGCGGIAAIGQTSSGCAAIGQTSSGCAGWWRDCSNWTDLFGMRGGGGIAAIGQTSSGWCEMRGVLQLDRPLRDGGTDLFGGLQQLDRPLRDARCCLEGGGPGLGSRLRAGVHRESGAAVSAAMAVAEWRLGPRQLDRPLRGAMAVAEWRLGPRQLDRPLRGEEGEAGVDGNWWGRGLGSGSRGRQKSQF
jgi:hypothetical protein